MPALRPSALAQGSSARCRTPGLHRHCSRLVVSVRAPEMPFFFRLPLPRLLAPRGTQRLFGPLGKIGQIRFPVLAGRLRTCEGSDRGHQGGREPGNDGRAVFPHGLADTLLDCLLSSSIHELHRASNFTFSSQRVVCPLTWLTWARPPSSTWLRRAPGASCLPSPDSTPRTSRRRSSLRQGAERTFAVAPGF